MRELGRPMSAVGAVRELELAARSCRSLDCVRVDGLPTLTSLAAPKLTLVRWRGACSKFITRHTSKNLTLFKLRIDHPRQMGASSTGTSCLLEPAVLARLWVGVSMFGIQTACRQSG
jgi:hypothetical protein